MSIAILGGGISGLSSGFYLKFLNKSLNRNLDIVLIEGSERLGGWVNSHVSETGTQYEIGPRSLRVTGFGGLNTLKLAEYLNLVPKIKPISNSHVSTKNRLIKVNGNLYLLPNDLKSLFKHQSPFSKSLARLVIQDLWNPKGPATEGSFYNFIERRFGSEIATYFADPVCRGVFAGNAKELSVNTFAKELFDLEQKYGSIIKGSIFNIFKRKNVDISEKNSVMSVLGEKAIKEFWSIWSLEGGISSLVHALENDIKKDVEILKNFPISEINVDNGRMVISSQEEDIITNYAISCLPANKLKYAVKNLNQQLSEILDQIQFVDVAVVNLEFEENLIKNPGFGYLVPSTESSNVLGVIYDSITFPNKNNTTVFTVMMGGHWFESLFGKNSTSDDFLDIAIKEIQETFSTTVKPCANKVSILKECIPQYTIGHLDRVMRARKILKDAKIPLYLTGNSYDGVGVNDVIYSAKKVVSNIDFI